MHGVTRGRDEGRERGSQDMPKNPGFKKKHKAYSDSTDVELLELSDNLRGRLWCAPV